MNFLKKAFCLIALCAISSVDARTGKKPAPAAARRTTPARAAKKQVPAKKAPATRRAAAQPAANANAIQKLRMNTLARNNIDPKTKLFNGKWMMDTAEAATKAGIGQIGLRFALQAARDKYLPLTGNDQTDLEALRAINGQIENVVVTLQ